MGCLVRGSFRVRSAPACLPWERVPATWVGVLHGNEPGSRSTRSHVHGCAPESASTGSPESRALTPGAARSGRRSSELLLCS